MNCYGIDKFHIEIVEECSEEELNEKEIYYIKKFNSLSPNGYNMTAGGDGVRKKDYELIVKQYKECGENISECQRRYGHSYDAIKNAMREYGLEAHKTRDIPIYECDANNNIIREFPTQQAVIDAYPELYMTLKSFQVSLTASRLTRYRGKYFCRVKDYEEYKKIDHRNKCYEPIICLQTGEEFESMSAAARWVKENHPEVKGKVGTVVGNISKAIENNWDSYGYTWKKLKTK